MRIERARPNQIVFGLRLVPVVLCHDRHPRVWSYSVRVPERAVDLHHQRYASCTFVTSYWKDREARSFAQHRRRRRRRGLFMGNAGMCRVGHSEDGERASGPLGPLLNGMAPAAPADNLWAIRWLGLRVQPQIRQVRRSRRRTPEHCRENNAVRQWAAWAARGTFADGASSPRLPARAIRVHPLHPQLMLD